jgi:hypothetical protein
MTLEQLVDAAPEILDVIALNPEFKLTKEIKSIVRKTHSKRAALTTATIRQFHLRKCLMSHWGLGVQVSLVKHLVRVHVMQEGCPSSEDKTSIQALAAVPLIQDIMNLSGTGDWVLGQLFTCGFSFRVEVVGGCCSEQAQGGFEGEDDDDEGAKRWVHSLRAIRWKMGSVYGNFKTSQKLVEEIGMVYDGEDQGITKWDVGIHLSDACKFVGGRYDQDENEFCAVVMYHYSLQLYRDLLGEWHPVTAQCASSCFKKDFAFLFDEGRAIDMQEQALRIFEYAHGQHPGTVSFAWHIALMIKRRNPDKSFDMFTRALRLCERVHGRCHAETALHIIEMAKLYCESGDFAQAETLGLEALDIFTKTKGPLCLDTIASHYFLADLYKKVGNVVEAQRHDVDDVDDDDDDDGDDDHVSDENSDEDADWLIGADDVSWWRKLPDDLKKECEREERNGGRAKARE